MSDFSPYNEEYYEREGYEWDEDEDPEYTCEYCGEDLPNSYTESICPWCQHTEEKYDEADQLVRQACAIFEELGFDGYDELNALADRIYPTHTKRRYYI